MVIRNIKNRVASTKKLLSFRRPKIGAKPGALAYDKRGRGSQVAVHSYSPEMHEKNPDDLRQLVKNSSNIIWIDVQGLGDADQIESIAELAEIPHLMLEDMVNVPQRSHADHVRERLLMVTRMIYINEKHQLTIEQVSIYVYRNIVVTFQEEVGDVFAPIRRRLKNSAGPLRNGTSTFLAYTLLDTIYDSYFPVLEQMADHLQAMEQFALLHPTSSLLHHLTHIRNEVLRTHRAIRPQKEMINTLLKDKDSLLEESVLLHLRDSYDHVAQASDVMDTLRDMSVNLLNLYMSSMANNTNEKMKVLTIMASIFIPLTFIAGIYGMNFEYMPELHVAWAYPMVWIVMGLTAVGLLGYFYHKGWIIEQSGDLEAITSNQFRGDFETDEDE